MKSKKPVRRAAQSPRTRRIAEKVPPTPVTSATSSDATEPVETSWWNKVSLVQVALGSVGITIAGVFAYFAPFISPIKNSVLHYLYTEKANIKLSCNPCSINKGEATRINIEISPSPSIDIAEGVIKLNFNDRELALSEETPSSFETSKITAKRLLEKSFLLYPNKPSESPIRSSVAVVLETKYGIHRSAPIHILIEPRKSDDTGPHIEVGGKHHVVLTGEWQLELGASLGRMKIYQTEKDDIFGNYWLNGPEGRIEAKVDGYKDGTSFKVFFEQPKKQSRWRIDANYFIDASEKGVIEIKGCAFSIRPDSNIVTNSAFPVADCTKRNYIGWKGDAATTFWASARLH